MFMAITEGMSTGRGVPVTETKKRAIARNTGSLDTLPTTEAISNVEIEERKW